MDKVEQMEIWRIDVKIRNNNKIKEHKGTGHGATGRLCQLRGPHEKDMNWACEIMKMKSINAERWESSQADSY